MIYALNIASQINQSKQIRKDGEMIADIWSMEPSRKQRERVEEQMLDGNVLNSLEVHPVDFYVH
jgi:hypothetical protein